MKWSSEVHTQLVPHGRAPGVEFARFGDATHVEGPARDGDHLFPFEGLHLLRFLAGRNERSNDSPSSSILCFTRTYLFHTDGVTQRPDAESPQAAIGGDSSCARRRGDVTTRSNGTRLRGYDYVPEYIWPTAMLATDFPPKSKSRQLTPGILEHRHTKIINNNR